MVVKSAACRPLVGVYSVEKGESKMECKVSRQVGLPDVFQAPIRNDLVSFVHDQLSKNRRQPFSVTPLAGVQCSAKSWGTGRAVARIPRIKGSGSHRASQGAYGNMCRGGHMFNPTKVWRRWFRRVNCTQRRHAVVSGLAASALPSLVMARGHKIMNVPELPLILDSKCSAVSELKKTKAAIDLLKTVGVYDDVERCKLSKKIRVGKGKMRNRRYVISRGPLLVHTYAADSDFVHAFRNIPGIDLINVNRINLLKLTPGGHLGRFVVWTSDAMEQLSKIYPNQHHASDEKKGYVVPHSMINMPDISRIINSDEVQKVLRPKLSKLVPAERKRNPLKHFKIMDKLNPYFRLHKMAIKARKTLPDAKKKVKGVVKRSNKLVKKEMKAKTPVKKTEPKQKPVAVK